MTRRATDAGRRLRQIHDRRFFRTPIVRKRLPRAGKAPYRSGMEHNIQVSIDCADPHAQADWWAESLGWIVEPVDQGFIDRMLAEGYAGESDVLEHRGSRVWRAGAAVCKADQLTRRDRLRLVFQPVPEPKTVKNRVHLDVHLTGTDKDAARSALEARGARFLYEASQGPLTWYTMADPEGNEFCIS
jgi:hypothetical protein